MNYLSQEFLPLATIIIVLGVAGPNAIFWAAMGLLRRLSERPRQSHGEHFSVADVAVVIAAYNEEVALPNCLSHLSAILPVNQVFVANDSSKDGTAGIAEQLGCNVYTAPMNMGKGRVLDAAIRRFQLTKKYKAILFLDADSQIDAKYLEKALPLLSVPGTAVVAGHVVSRRPTARLFAPQLIHYYRCRLYDYVQAFFRYGQTWAPFDVLFVAPGFASIYRSSVLDQTNIAAPGLVIEDINLTFEVHRRSLGRVAYSSEVRCTTEDPSTIGDYSKQVRRWSLGLWQTARRNGVWPSKFWLFFSLLQLEMLAYALIVLGSLGALLLELVLGLALQISLETPMGIIRYTPGTVVAGMLLADFLFSILYALVTLNLRSLLFACFFPLLRIIDSFWTIGTIGLAAFTTSDGRWQSPQRLQDPKKA